VIELRAELARASAMLDVRRFDEASELLARVVSSEPESSRAWCLMARAHLGADRYDDAVAAANRAVALDPADEWPHRLASNALVHLGKFPDALRAAYGACRLAPSYWQTHVCVAQAALAAQRPDIASEAAARARALAPNEPDVHFLSGKVSLARGDLAAAREHQEQALALDPAHSGAMNELGRIRLRKHDTTGAIRHFISAARATPDEGIYSRNIDVVLLRTVSRTIYVFTLIALILIWIPAVTHVDRLPFVIGLGALAVVTAGCFAWMVLRLPREARLMVRRTLRARGVAMALALAVGGVAVAFGIVAFAPSANLPQVLPIAVVVTVAARLAAFAALRATAKKRLSRNRAARRARCRFLAPVLPGNSTDGRQGQHDRAAQQSVHGPHGEDRRGPEHGGERSVDRVPDHADAVGRERRERADPGEHFLRHLLLQGRPEEGAEQRGTRAAAERGGGHPAGGRVQGHRDVRQRVAERAEGGDHQRAPGPAAE
jgi:tetratricopeptide (TPR) repeat protein